MLISIVLSGGSQNIMESLPGMHSAFRTDHSLSVVPQTFCSALVKLVAMQMQALGVSTFFSNFLLLIRCQICCINPFMPSMKKTLANSVDPD